MSVSIAIEAYPALKKAGLLDSIDDVLMKAAIVTHPRGNRRYHHFILDVQGGVVKQVTDTRIQRGKVNHEEFVVYEQCDCNGTEPNCYKCKGHGEVKVVRRMKSTH